MRISHVSIALRDAIRVKSAEYWLTLGQPVQALLELEQLPRRARKHPWATKVLLSVFRELVNSQGCPGLRFVW